MCSKYCFFPRNIEYSILCIIVLATLLRHLRHSDDLSEEYNTYLTQFNKRLNDLQTIVQRENSDPLPNASYLASKLPAHVGLSSDSETFCVGTCLPKFLYIRAWWLWIPSKKLFTCLIPKNMSSMLRAAMCYLNNPKKFASEGRHFYTEMAWKSSCRNNTSYHYLETSNITAENALSRFTGASSVGRQIFKELRPFAIVREPVDRFISTFVDKCVNYPSLKEMCNGCQRNLTCFLITEYDRFMQRKLDVAFTYNDEHFAPQNWRCDFRNHLDDYQLVRYNDRNSSANAERLRQLLAGHSVSRAEVDFVANELHAKRTFHATAGLKMRNFLERRLRGSPFLMELLVRMYYWDFILFNYPIPDIRFNPIAGSRRNSTFNAVNN